MKHYSMEHYRYELAKKGKNICPRCERKSFVLYVDTETNNPLHTSVGKCDRADKCAHHYTPKQYFADNRLLFDYHGGIIRHEPVTHKPPPSAMDTNTVMQSLRRYEYNNFVQYLYNTFGVDAANTAIGNYLVGTSKHWEGATVFWQIDTTGNIRDGKIMLYNANTGKRIKEPVNKISWAHTVLKLTDFTLSQCLFGEHLLKGNNKTVAIVESEKSALIASIYLPEFIWLACGGSQGINRDKCSCLQGRNVILYPDLGMFDKWNKKAKELSVICNVFASDLLERHATQTERTIGFDIADYLLKTPYKVTERKIAVSEIKPLIPIEEDLPTVTFERDIADLENYFENITLPTTPIKLNAWTTITDANLFVNGSLSTLKNYSRNKVFFPCMERLKHFKTIIEA